MPAGQGAEHRVGHRADAELEGGARGHQRHHPLADRPVHPGAGRAAGDGNGTSASMAKSIASSGTTASP